MHKFANFVSRIIGVGELSPVEAKVVCPNADVRGDGVDSKFFFGHSKIVHFSP